MAITEVGFEHFSRWASEWHAIWRSDSFWNFYAEHYCLYDDFGTSKDLFPEFRTALPQHLSQFVAEAYRTKGTPGIIGLFYSNFSHIGREVEEDVVSPISRRLNASLDSIISLVNGDSYSKSQQTFIHEAHEIEDLLRQLREFQIDNYSPVQVLREKTADKLRSISIDLHNKHNDIKASKHLLEIGIMLTESQTYHAQAAKDKAQLRKNEFWKIDLLPKLEAVKDNPEKCYQVLIKLDATTPDEIRSDEDFIQLRRKTIFGYAYDIFDKGKQLFEKRSEDSAANLFSRSQHYLLVKHLPEFNLNAEKVLEMSNDLSREILAIRNPSQIVLADTRMKGIREIAEKLEMDDESKYAFVLICESAIYRDTAPYLKRVRYGQYLINIGNWTWFIYGIGVVFWILGYLYKRKMI